MSNISFNCRHEYKSGFQLDVDFATAKQTVSLFGPSGSGKTSILSMLVGFTTPTMGRIQIGDRVFFDSEKRINIPCEQRNMGLVAQDHLVFPHMNVDANLKFGLRRGSPHSQINPDKLLKQVCTVLELGPLLKRYPGNLSGGENQRVAIGRALMSRPGILLFDEPLSALDAGLNNQILTHLEQIIEELKIPVIFVSHRQAHVRRLADWVVVMESGAKVAEGAPDEALSHTRPMAWKNAIGPVNLLKVERVRLDGQRWIGHVGNQVIQIPQVSQTKDRLFLQCTPRDVTLGRDDVLGLSSRNHLAGTVRKVFSVANRQFVAVDIGQIIWAEVTSQSVQEIGLKPGTPVTCFIKTQSLEIVD